MGMGNCKILCYMKNEDSELKLNEASYILGESHEGCT